MSKIIKYVIIASIVLFFGSALICGIMDADENKAAAAPIATATTTPTPNNYYDIVSKVLKDKLTNVIYNSDTNLLLVEFKEKENLNGKLTVHAMYKDMVDTMHKLSGVNVDFIVKYDINGEENKVMSASFCEDTIKIINSDSCFIFTDIPIVADDYWEALIITNTLKK